MEPDEGHTKVRFKPPAGFSRELAALTYFKIQRPRDCKICFYRFCSAKNLIRHLDRFKDRKYPCDECGTKFRDAKLLRTHITDAHEFNRLKKPLAKCPVCNQRFSIEMHFRFHLCHYHGEWVDEKIGKFDSKARSDKTETGSENSGDQLAASMKARKRHLFDLIKDIARKTAEDNEEQTLIDGQNMDSEWESASKSNEMAEAYDDQIQRDAELRILYSCKDCYVPLLRIDAKRKRPMESPYRADDAKRRRRAKKRVKQQQKRKNHQSERKKIHQLELPVFKMPPVTFLSTDDLLKSKGNDYEMAYEASDAPEECVDPLDVGHESVENNRHVDRSSTETTIAEPTESCDLSTPNIPFKVEPMDCEVDEDAPVKTESSAEASDPPNHPDQNEAMNFVNVPCTEFDDGRIADGLNTEMKIEIDEHTISGHSDPGTDNDAAEAESLGTPDEDSSQIESSILSDGEDKPEPDQMMVASRICNKLFASKRAMLRHCRDSHLLCHGDTVHCTCGKKMIGRRALEGHFSRHCYKLVKTQRPESNPRTPCKPLDKRYMCDKCGERFWLESCCKDHPPDCELHKVQPQQQQQQPKPNLDEIRGSSVSHIAETGEYVCQICDSIFMTVENLLKHVRMFPTNGKHLPCPCPICRTEFPSARLLKGHIHSAHMPILATPYPHTCPICHQGFTKNHYLRVHMMHIHAKVMTSSSNSGAHDDHQRVSSLAIENTTSKQCSLCNLVFVSHKRCVDHVDYYDKSAVVRCHICGKVFAGRFNAHHHRKKVHYAGNMPNSYAHCCAICSEGFMYKTHLHAHMVHVHGKEMKGVVASKTNVRWEDNDYSIVEESEKEMSKKKGYKCDRCNMDFRNWSGWNFHIKNAHPTDDYIDSTSFHNKPTNRAEPGRDVTIFHPTPSVDLPRDSVDSSGDDSMSSDKFDNLVDPKTGILTPRRIYEVENIETSASAKNAPKSSLCTVCGYNCPEGVAKHKAMFANRGSYSCEFCGRRFIWQSFYRDHKLKHFRRDVHNNCFCPVCDEGFENVQFLEMHTIHLHQRSLEELALDGHNIYKNDPLSTGALGDAPKESSNSVQLTTCNICRMVFVNNEKLKNHLKNYHSLAEAKDPTTRKRSNNGDRFYVFAGDNAQSQMAANMGNGENGSSNRAAMTNNLYRYDSSLICKYCDFTFTSKDTLNLHQEVLHNHKTRSNLEFASGNVYDRTQQSEIRAIEVSSPNHMIRGNIQIASSGSITESHGKPNVASQRPQTEASKRVVECLRVIPVLQNTNDAKTGQATHHTRVVNSYQCRDCGIVFVDKNRWITHERHVHNLISPGDEWPNGIVPTAQPPEEITISDEDTESVSAAPKNPLPSDKTERKLPTRLVPLPPGLYKIAKLKVRSADTTIGKVVGTSQRPPLKKA